MVMGSKEKIYKNKINKEEAIKIVKECNNIADFCRKVGWQPRGDNYKIFHKYVKEYNLDTSHFTGLKSNLGNKNNSSKEKTVEEYIKGTSIRSTTLLKKLLKEGLKERKCECCGNTHWNKELIPLELHHKDGNHFNNELDNLEILCPNCHYFTETYRGRKNKTEKQNFCSICGKEISKWSKSGICAECAHKKQRKCERPTKEELEKLLLINSVSAIGRMYNVSFNAVKKWIKKYNILT